MASISLADIRAGGPERVSERLAGLRDGQWAVVNATEYSDLEAVACAVHLAERAGQRLLLRTGPSFVRAMTGAEPAAPLRGAQLWPGGRRARARPDRGRVARRPDQPPARRAARPR